MIQFILMLLGLAFPNNNTHTTSDNNHTPDIVVTYSATEQSMDEGGNGNGNGHGNGGNTGGNTGQLPPPGM